MMSSIEKEKIKQKDHENKNISLSSDNDKKKANQTKKNINTNNIDSKKQISDLEEKLKDLEDKNLRLLAENDNIRKIHVREIKENQLYAIKEFASSLLAVADNFQRAREAVPKDMPEDNLVKNLLIGFDAIEKELIEILEKNGIKKFDSLNKRFDPELHQAVSKANSEKVEKGFVINELQPGFKIADRLLRPAMVVVSEGSQKN